MELGAFGSARRDRRLMAEPERRSFASTRLVERFPACPHTVHLGRAGPGFGIGVGDFDHLTAPFFALLGVSRASPRAGGSSNRLGGSAPTATVPRHGATRARTWTIARSHPQPGCQTKFATAVSAASNCSTSTWRAPSGIIPR